MNTPLCLGGQGRTDASVERDGSICLGVLAIAVSLVVLAGFVWAFWLVVSWITGN